MKQLCYLWLIGGSPTVVFPLMFICRYGFVWKSWEFWVEFVVLLAWLSCAIVCIFA